MKRTSLIQILVLAALIFTGACSSNVWDELPEKISSFVAEYFPGQGIKSYSEEGDGEHVVLNNGTSILFDKNQEWTTVDLGGSVMPEVFLYDCLPPALFQYLEETSNTDHVYKVERTSREYILTLTNTYITYNLESGEINYPPAAG